MRFLAVPGALLAAIGVAVFIFKMTKALVRFIIAIDTLIRSIEENTKAHRKISAEVGRMRKVTTTKMMAIEGRVTAHDSRLKEIDQVLSKPRLRRAG